MRRSPRPRNSSKRYNLDRLRRTAHRLRQPAQWVRQQLQLYRKLRPRRAKEPSVLAVVQAGRAEELKGVGLAGLKIIGSTTFPASSSRPARHDADRRARGVGGALSGAAFVPARRDHIFFGREGTISEMVDRLAQHRFLAVTGFGVGQVVAGAHGLLDALDRGSWLKRARLARRRFSPRRTALSRCGGAREGVGPSFRRRSSA